MEGKSICGIQANILQALLNGVIIATLVNCTLRAICWRVRSVRHFVAFVLKTYALSKIIYFQSHEY